jgi:hypothetical protein
VTVPLPHKAWTLDVLPVPLTQWIGTDEMLTQLWLRLAYANKKTTRRESSRTLVLELATMIEADSEHFRGFDAGSDVAETWLRADLVKTLKGKKNIDQFSVARPVHLPATRLRNLKREGDANASAIPYQWIRDLDPALGEEVKAWLSVDELDIEELGDLPTFALAALAQNEAEDVVPPAGAERPGIAPMLCTTRGQWYVEDLRALMAYRNRLPRAVLIDHVKRITTLHVALHLIQTFSAVVAIAADPSAGCGCPEGHSPCAWMPLVVTDCGEDSRSNVAKLAEASWADVEGTLARYIRAHLALRKLKEFGDSSMNKKKLDTKSVRGLASIRTKATGTSLDDWSNARIELLGANFSELAEQYYSLGLRPFDVYMSLLYSDGERRWFGYHRQVLDSVFGKNFRDGAMRQPLGQPRNRRLALSPPLLETIVLAAMVRFDGTHTPVTRSLRVDQLVDRLAERYGMLVMKPPPALQNDPVVTSTMLSNHLTLRTRLRQAGLFVDQSDAFLAQTIRPRVTFAS